MVNRNKRFTIGLMVHHLENDYSTELIKGAITAAEEKDVNLVILPGRGINAEADDEKYSVYDYQYNVIYDYVSKANLDALIVSVGTVGSYINRDEMLDFLHSYKDLPVVTLEAELPGIPCIKYEDDGMKLAVDYVIQKCGCTKVGFVSGYIGNADAQTRLRCYKESLEANGLEFDESYVVYGNFSEFTEEITEELLDRHPDIEAICFANDNMCVGAYNVFQKRGIKVGEDLFVTGFDDSEVSTSLKPMLTTVRTNISEMGYTALSAAYEYALTGRLSSKIMHAQLIIRESTGKTTDAFGTHAAMKSLAHSNEFRTIVYSVFYRYLGNMDNLSATSYVKKFITIVECELNDVCLGRKMDFDKYTRMIDDVFAERDRAKMQVSIMKKVLQSACSLLLELDEDNVNHFAIMKIYSYMLSNLLDYNMMELYQVHTNLTYSSFIITNINKDMMLNSDDEEKSFFSIVSNLHNVNFRSSYIYIYKDPVVHYQYEKWRTPENIYLKAFNIGDNVKFLEPVAQEMPLLNCINNEYTPDDRRFTFVLVPLFSNEEQYGLFVCELDSDYFSQIYSVAPQICAAIKMTKLLKELELNLAEAKDANAELEKISDLDELTGAYNRRGFYRAVNAAINSPDNRGKKAIFFLADLDNLKVINDTFGHKEGDFALKTSTDYLRGASREFYAVGRIGGDEFAAFTLAGDGEEPQAVQKEIYDSIKQEAVCFNKKCPKPYNVTISLGSCSFKCGSGKLIQNYINAADERLYVDKKNKNRKVIKEEK